MTAARPLVACLGAGRMGRGIAVAFAYAGHAVTMIDVKARSAEQFAALQAEALGEVRKTLASLARFGLLTDDEADAVCVILSGRAVCHVSTLPAVSGPLLYSEHDFTGDEASAALRAMGGNGPLPRGIDPDLVIRCIGPGCIAGGQACLVGTPQSYTCTALEPLEVAVFPRRMFTSMAEDGPEGGETPSTAASRVHAVRRATLLEVTLAIARSLVPLLRLFMSLGLQRLWLKSGEVLFSAGQPQDGLYVSRDVRCE